MRRSRRARDDGRVTHARRPRPKEDGSETQVSIEAGVDAIRAYVGGALALDGLNELVRILRSSELRLPLEIDVARVRSVDTSGLALLLYAARRAEIRLRGASKELRHMLAVCDPEGRIRVA